MSISSLRQETEAVVSHAPNHMTSRSGLSFRQIRRTAKAVSQLATEGAGDGLARAGILSAAFLDDITHELRRDASGQRLEVSLALLEWERLGSDSKRDNLDFLLETISGEVADEDGLRCLVQIIDREYTQEEFLDFVDWVVHTIGARASRALEGMVHHHSRKQPSRMERSVSSPALFLSSLSLSRRASLPAAYFQVTALDVYVRRHLSTHTSARLDEILTFGAILSLETRHAVLQHSLELRRAQLRLEYLLAPLSEHAGHIDENELDEGFMDYSGLVKGRTKLFIRREAVLSDSMHLLNTSHSSSLANGVEIVFENEYGKDGGGLLKEWSGLLLEQLLPSVMQREETDAKQYNVQSNCSRSEAELLGVVVGLSVLHSVPIGLRLPSHVYPFLQDIDQVSDLTLDDLAEVRPGLAQGLMEILNWPEEEFNDRLSMSFCYTTTDGTAVPLIEDGEKRTVTYETRHLFAQRVCEYVLIEEREEQLTALRDGFHRVWMQVDGIRLFSSDEMAGLIAGQEIGVDAVSLRKLCPVDMARAGDAEYMDAFWDILHTAESHTPGVVKKLLLFVTASHRLPLVLQQDGQRPMLAFRIVLLGDDKFASRLPFASTCGNILFLPRYPSIDILRSRLLTALEYGSVGFGRS